MKTSALWLVVALVTCVAIDYFDLWFQVIRLSIFMALAVVLICAATEHLMRKP